MGQNPGSVSVFLGKILQFFVPLKRGQTYEQGDKKVVSFP